MNYQLEKIVWMFEFHNEFTARCSKNVIAFVDVNQIL